MSKASNAPDVPDDVVSSVPVERFTLSIYAFDEKVSSIELRCVDGAIPLKIGERVEFEVAAIERRVTER